MEKNCARMRVFVFGRDGNGMRNGEEEDDGNSNQG
jgi:hypothetical protein